ncbi:hypothetical protein EN981_23225 [Mesorhizobium sp. M7A.F.Ca.CA.001.13.2.1]|nr:hypothetical protein EN981_23225 [Mesorhizobium sp. M7A.F.Ca.CA.001.13.2.1]
MHCSKRQGAGLKLTNGRAWCGPACDCQADRASFCPGASIRRNRMEAAEKAARIVRTVIETLKPGFAVRL